MVAAPFPLRAVERGAAADRDERVLEPAPASMVGVHVTGRDHRHAERGREIGKRGVPARVAALERPLELDVERTRKRLREPGRGVRVDHAEPVRGAAGEADEPFGVGGDDLGRRLRRQELALAPLDARARVRVGEDPAEVLVAAPALAEKRHVRPTCKRDLGTGDRAQAEVLGRLRELERAVDAVVVGQRKRVVPELDRPGRELLRQRRAVQERVGRMRVQLDIASVDPPSSIAARSSVTRAA